MIITVTWNVSLKVRKISLSVILRSGLWFKIKFMAASMVSWTEMLVKRLEAT